MKNTLEDIVEEIEYNSALPRTWYGVQLKRFSTSKDLFDFQETALKNALKALWLFYKESEEKRKDCFYENYENRKISLKPCKTMNGYFADYEKDYPVSDNEISFIHFINRMSFWMATGSGKTLVIIKLIEILGNLVLKKVLPERDILFLAHREDLINQFKALIDEFNQIALMKITLINLKDYDRVKHETLSLFSNSEIKVFYYRSDLISDEQKENIINFRNYDNNGKWFVLLDEAHKGDKEDSKRQNLYSILSRNGFLFNFSATFTDANDNATCVFNFNLGKFINKGYGKHVYVSKKNIEGFGQQDDFSEEDKQRIVLKTFILQTCICNHFKEISKVGDDLYHKPLLLTLVNSVNKSADAEKIPDLKLFFIEITKIASNTIQKEVFESAKKELIEEMETGQYFFGERNLEIDKTALSKIDYGNVLEAVFNTRKSGKIEVIKIPGNNKELIFKLQTATKPFALIRIGDIYGWVKDILKNNVEITESHTDESVFDNINRRDSGINILMGSRTFYEGWDSNRPNIILFINIGKNKEAKKFVLQSIGRGVRIEPKKNKRKRLLSLTNSDEIKKDLFDKIKDHIPMMESLFVFGTKAEMLSSIIESMREEEEYRDLGDLFTTHKDAIDRNLFIPIYKNTQELIVEKENRGKYKINEEDLEGAKNLLDYIGDTVAFAKYECDPKILNKTKESFENQDGYYSNDEDRALKRPTLSLSRIFTYFSLENKELNTFKKLENEIVHFTKIKFKGEDSEYNTIKERIEIMKNSEEASKELQESYGKIPYDEYRHKLAVFDKAKSYTPKGNKEINIKYIANHYYHPLLVSEKEKVDYLTHIIDVSSEVKFLNELKLKGQDKTLFTGYDWWMFSKLDETLDKVFIPYYSPAKNDFAEFNPDFIFWAQKDKDYHIIFIDPKGMTYTDYQYKADWYSKLFGAIGEEKEFTKHGLKIKVYLRFFNGDEKPAPQGYAKYWIDKVKDISKICGRI